ncbi:MAG: Asp-tRNA(Asn)/Glu-tRNA(Gln) amidotransferase subunit GatB [Candidatus Acidiferrales bacterium]
MAKTTEEAGCVAAEVMARYEAVIGLEVHAQLLTETKAFCACSRRFGDAPNSNTCPVCLGLPGALPVLNRKALELAMRASLALHCAVQERSRFARKNYFYPDLPKGYQISQYELPLATEGWLEIEHGGAAKRIGITRVHMEEDAAKNIHEGFPESDRYSYIDFNRGGVPLIEIVSEPDLRAPAEAHAYLTALKQILLYTEVSDCNMEEGSLRCDANVSVRARGAEKFGTKVEVKNLNSFRFLQRALEHEIERQIGAIESGGVIAQETRLYNVAAGRTESMRSKEFAHDYRYFPDPDLLPVVVDAALQKRVLESMPELPEAKRGRFVRDYGITAYDAGVLAATRGLADYFEAVVRAGAPGKAAANWISTELLGRLNESGKEISDSPVTPAGLAGLIGKVEAGEITGATGKKVFARMFETGKSAADVIAAEGYSQISDTGEIERIARAIVAKNPENAAKYRGGNEGVFKFFVGQVMRETRGQANPQAVNEILKRILGES